MHETGQIITDGAIRVSVGLEHDRKDRIRLDCIRDGTLVSIRLSADAALDLIEDVRGARVQLLRPGADDVGNVVAQANVIQEPVELPNLLADMAEVFDSVAEQSDGGHDETMTLRYLADACRVRVMGNERLEKARTTGS